MEKNNIMFEPIDFWQEQESVKKDTDNSGVEDIEDKMIYLFKQKTMQVISKIEEIGLPKKNQQLRLITMRSFNAVAFLKYISNKETITQLNLVVYSINYEAAKIINDLIKEGKVKKATILISNLRNKAHRTKEQITKDMFVSNPNIDLFFCSSHAKIMNFETSEGNYYNVEGSGNLSFNSRVEQYIIDNCEELYDFTCKWMCEIRENLKGKKELIET